jgi:serine/threonine protein kinase
LTSELKIMIHLGKHLNIVNLLGAVTKNINKQELLVIVEFCCFGNLQEYLQKHRKSFENQIVDGEVVIKPTYANVKKATSSSYVLAPETLQVPIKTADLISWSFQVANGMNYLSSRKIIHGDLAARNVLLCENNVVKICDFGLAKSLYKNYTYQCKEGAKLPFRWLALETMIDRVFSIQSDVWSFGKNL